MGSGPTKPCTLGPHKCGSHSHDRKLTAIESSLYPLKETNGILEDILNTNETNVVPLFPGFSFFARYDTATCSNIQEVQSAMYYGFCNTMEGGGSYGTMFLDFESCSSVLFTWPTSLNCTGPNFSEASDGRSLEGKVFDFQRYTLSGPEHINFATFACIDSKRSSCAPQHPPLRFPLSELDQSMGYFVQMNARNKEYTCEEAKAYINAVGPEAAFNTQGEDSLLSYLPYNKCFASGFRIEFSEDGRFMKVKQYTDSTCSVLAATQSTQPPVALDSCTDTVYTTFIKPHPSKCLWETGCSVQKGGRPTGVLPNGAVPGTVCKEYEWWSQVQEIDYNDPLYPKAEGCYATVDGPFGGKHWGCKSNAECCNIDAACDSGKLCRLPCDGDGVQYRIDQVVITAGNGKDTGVVDPVTVVLLAMGATCAFAGACIFFYRRYYSSQRSSKNGEKGEVEVVSQENQVDMIVQRNRE